MTIFNLPDLGEGLPDAEIHEWFVKEGDEVRIDQPLVSMETAKAVVEVPCPQAGIIEQLFGKAGDIIKTGEPLVKFKQNESARDNNEPNKDSGTVVGHLEESTDNSPDEFIIGKNENTSTRIKATPAVKLLAKKYQIDLSTLQGTGENGLITKEDVERMAKKEDVTQNVLKEGFEPLRGVRRMMLKSMVQSHKEVVPVSIFDEACLYHWDETRDITVSLIRAVTAACAKEPALNAWFDTESQSRRLFKEVHLGLAMDSEDGLFVPVIQDAQDQKDEQLRQIINRYKSEVHNRSISPDAMKGATITLSNFGKFAGRFASPIIVPPMVAIIAVGKRYTGVTVHDGQVQTKPMLPLSLSFDHRAVTGGEATRFLGAMIESLQAP